MSKNILNKTLFLCTFTHSQYCKFKNMTPKLLFNFLIIIFFIPLLLSCASVKNIEYRNLEVVKIDKLNLTETQLQISLSCYNPNNFGVKLQSSKLDIYLNDNIIGSSEQTQSISIPKKSSFKSPLSVRINLKKTIINLGLGLLNQEFDLKVRGNVNVKKGILVKTLPVEINKKLKLDLLK